MGTTTKTPPQDRRWLQGVLDDYQKIFVEPWSPYLGAVLISLMCAVLMLDGLFWGVFGGLKLWGDYLNQWIGLGPILGIANDLQNPLHHRTSLMNIVLILGALSAALFSRQFSLNRPPKLELIWGAVGGTLMGVGATLAGGCTIGGFFTPLMFSSAAGWMMWVGLVSGALIGLKLLIWTMENISWGTKAPISSAPTAIRQYFPLIGIAVLGVVMFWAIEWIGAEDKKIASRAIIILCGFILGFILHRTRFCFSRVFREPFMTAEGEMTKAMILMIAIAIPLGSVLIQHNNVDPYAAIPASFWLGSLLGGLIFGIGMIFAGGCATGSLWRIAEGHIKLFVALFFFSWVGSLSSGIFKKLGLLQTDVDIDFLDGIPEISRIGYQAYLPDLWEGWGLVYLFSFVVLLCWYLLVRYNESTERFTVL